jgi:hypothetical protein
VNSTREADLAVAAWDAHADTFAVKNQGFSHEISVLIVIVVRQIEATRDRELPPLFLARVI